MHGCRPIFILALMLTVAGGCAARAHLETAPASIPPSDQTPTSTSSNSPLQQEPSESLESYIARMRRVSMQARPPGVRRTQAVEAESRDGQLKHLLDSLRRAPNAEEHRMAAERYRRLGILDQAQDHLSEAVRLDPSDAAAYDARARIWRDWGYPNMGLGDAHRAVYYAARSPEAHNTLGTMYQALSQLGAARSEYEAAIALDGTAAYAHANLCALALIERRPDRALGSCRQALSLQPELKAARANLRQAERLTAGMDRAETEAQARPADAVAADGSPPAAAAQQAGADSWSPRLIQGQKQPALADALAARPRRR